MSKVIQMAAETRGRVELVPKGGNGVLHEMVDAEFAAQVEVQRNDARRTAERLRDQQVEVARLFTLLLEAAGVDELMERGEWDAALEQVRDAREKVEGRSLPSTVRQAHDVQGLGSQSEEIMLIRRIVGRWEDHKDVDFEKSKPVDLLKLIDDAVVGVVGHPKTQREDSGE
ncbi:MAG: hypothetical protein AAGJ81_10610 [Verrucomicrobiota bacterium]